jgi:hypothetical protein
METDAEYCEFPQAFDGIASVEDTMDAEYEWLDAPITDLDVKFEKGTNKVRAIVVKVAWDFSIRDVGATDDADFIR